jgi:hypothetical protein
MGTAHPSSGCLARQPYRVGHPMARLARLAASAGGSEASERAALIGCDQRVFAAQRLPSATP